jgi:hypothetical protein
MAPTTKNDGKATATAKAKAKAKAKTTPMGKPVGKPVAPEKKGVTMTRLRTKTHLTPSVNRRLDMDAEVTPDKPVAKKPAGGPVPNKSKDKANQKLDATDMVTPEKAKPGGKKKPVHEPEHEEDAHGEDDKAGEEEAEEEEAEDAGEAEEEAEEEDACEKEEEEANEPETDVDDDNDTVAEAKPPWTGAKARHDPEIEGEETVDFEALKELAKVDKEAQFSLAVLTAAQGKVMENMTQYERRKACHMARAGALPDGLQELYEKAKQLKTNGAVAKRVVMNTIMKASLMPPGALPHP